MKRLIARLGLTGLILTALQVRADPWFVHAFGELRSYHADWLAVCDHGGSGACRAVQIVPDPDGDSFFGPSRLTVRDGEGVVGGNSDVIEVYDSGMPGSLRNIVFDFGETEVALRPTQWRMGEAVASNVAETFVVTDAGATVELVDLMREARWLTVRYATPAGERMAPRFSLRGAMAVFDAIAVQRDGRD